MIQIRPSNYCDKRGHLKMGKKIVIIISVIILVISIGVLSLILFKQYQDSEGLFEYKQFGMRKIDEVISPEQEGNVIISRQLGYEFTIPEGFELYELGDSDAWNGNDSYTEFSIMNVEKQYALSVMMVPQDGDDFKNTNSEFDREQLLEEIFRRRFVNFAKPLVIYKDFCGLPCGYYDGITTQTRRDGTNVYMAKYEYIAPYVDVAFMAFGSEDAADEIKQLFDCFETLD